MIYANGTTLNDDYVSCDESINFILNVPISSNIVWMDLTMYVVSLDMCLNMQQQMIWMQQVNIASQDAILFVYLINYLV